MITGLSLFGTPRTGAPAIGAKAAAGLPPLGTRIAEFDTWRPGYAGAVVQVTQAGSTLLAPLFSDPYLANPISNPVPLLTLTDVNGQTYGKWPTTVYTYVPFTLFVNQGSQTGIERPPLVSVDGANISLGIQSSNRGNFPVSVSSFLDRDIDATLYGPLSAAVGATVCTATIALAVGAAASLGGGDVLLPFGTFPILNLTLPVGVVLRGKGESATILQSTQTVTPSITIGGDGAGLASLTLDGVSVLPQSIGVQAIGRVAVQFSRVIIKRFETCLKTRGIANSVWTNLVLTGGTYGWDGRGDMDAALSNQGSEIANIIWIGGEVSLCTQFGIGLLFFDQPVRDCTFEHVKFSTHLGDAVRLTGARGITFNYCQWVSNISNLSVVDGTNIIYIATNTTQRLRFNGGRMNAGKLTFNQTCLDIQFNSVRFENTSGVMSVPTNPIIFRDCINDALVTYTGDLSKILVQDSTDLRASVTGVTTDAAPLAAFQRTLAPGKAVFITAKAIARARNDITYGIFYVTGGAVRPGSSLPYQSQTGNFTVGLVLTGATSGASARITADADAGATGTLTIRDTVGTFVSGEIVRDTAAGSATFVGALTDFNAAMDAVGSTALRTAVLTGTGWTIAVAVSGALVQVLITGQAAKTIEWELDVEVLMP